MIKEMKKINEDSITITLEGGIVIAMCRNTFCLLNDIVHYGGCKGFYLTDTGAFMIMPDGSKEDLYGAISNAKEDSEYLFDKNEYESHLAQYIIAEAKEANHKIG